MATILTLVDRLLYRAAARPNGALFFACCVTAYTLAFALPLNYLTDNHTMKVVYSACAWVPLPFVWWFLFRGFIVPLFNRKADDDHHGNVFSYFFGLGAKLVAMSTIYMIMYIWDAHTFELISVSSKLNEWGMFVALSGYLTVGTAGPSTFDTTAPLSALITSLDLFLSFFMNMVILTSVIKNNLGAIRQAAVYHKPTDN